MPCFRGSLAFGSVLPAPTCKWWLHGCGTASRWKRYGRKAGQYNTPTCRAALFSARKALYRSVSHCCICHKRRGAGVPFLPLSFSISISFSNSISISGGRMSDKCPPFVRGGKSALFSSLAARFRSAWERTVLSSAQCRSYRKPRCQAAPQAPTAGKSLKPSQPSLSGGGSVSLSSALCRGYARQAATSRRFSAILSTASRGYWNIKSVFHIFQQHNGVAVKKFSFSLR